MYETWSYTLWNNLRELENEVLRIFGTKRHEIIEGLRKFHNEELKRILEKQDVVVWTGFIWLGTESSIGLL